MRAVIALAAVLTVAGCGSSAPFATRPADVVVANSGWTGWWGTVTVSTPPPRAEDTSPAAPVCREVTIPSDVLFASDSADPGPGLAQAVELALRVAREVPGPVVVEGYLDDRGPENIPLSLERARRVAEALTSAPPDPLEADRVRIVGRGEADPVASNATASGRAQNRRVEIHVGECSDLASPPTAPA